MDRFFSDQPVSVTVPLVDASGTLIPEIFTVEYRLLDDVGTEIVGWEYAITAPTDTEFVASIPAEANAITSPRGYRLIEVRIENVDGTTLKTVDYLLERSDALQPLENSFMTYGQAMIFAEDVTGLQTFGSADRSEKVRGLVNAFHTICDMAYRVQGEEINLKRMSQADFDMLPETFRSAICRAQVIEADEALNQFSIRRKRQEGLMSETIGESSMMFRPEKVLNVPLTRRSLTLLRPYLIWEMQVARG